MTFHAKRRDANEATIIAALRAVGAAVQQLDGDGVPDLLVSYEGVLYLVEVKNPNTKNGQRYTSDGLTPSQVAWFAEWTGVKPHVVQSVDEALRAIGARRE